MQLPSVSRTKIALLVLAALLVLVAIGAAIHGHARDLETRPDVDVESRDRDPAPDTVSFVVRLPVSEDEPHPGEAQAGVVPSRFGILLLLMVLYRVWRRRLKLMLEGGGRAAGPIVPP